MAVVIESIQNDLHKMNMERLRILATLLAAFLEAKSNQMETNTSLQNINYFIKLMEDARKNGTTEMPVDISTYQADMRPEITAALDAKGIKYVMMPGPTGDFIMTDSSPETRQAINAIRMGTDKIIAGATMVVALDSGVFGAQNNNRKCTMYTDLNKQQVHEFKRLAQENGFQFGLSETDGKYAVVVTNDVAERYHLNQFAHECATFNKSGLFNAYKDLEALQARKMQDKFWEDSQNKPTQDVVYVDLNSPSHYIELTNDTVTVHTPTSAETFPADKVNLQDILGKAAFGMENGAANYVKVSKADFMATYKAGPLDNDARMAFVAAERELSTTAKHSIMIEQITRMAEKTPSFDALKSMSKVFVERAQQLPENSEQRRVMEEFAQAYASNDRIRMNQLATSGQLTDAVGKIEANMVKMALNNQLTPTQFVHATVMASAERQAMNRGLSQEADLIVANAFNTQKISDMMKSQDAVAAGFTTAQNPDLSANFTDLFSQAVQTISNNELKNNVRFMSDIRETMQVLRYQQTLANMIETAQIRGDTKLAEVLQQGSADERTAKIALIAAGKSPAEAGFIGLDSKASIEQFLDVYERAVDKAIENPTVSLSQLSHSSSIAEHYGSTMFADIVSPATLTDMISAEKMVSRTEIEGADIAGALEETNRSGNDARDARSSADPDLNQGNRNDGMDFLDL